MVKDSNFQLDHIKKVSKLYTKSKKVTDIYRLLTPEYQEFNDTVEKVSYSNDDFLLCTPEEKAQFVNTELITFESVVCNTIYEKYGIMHSWIDVFNLMQDPIYKTVEKINRKVIYSSMVPNRPIGDTAFDTWNGLQIIDLDIKEATIADALKPIIFNELKKYHWFLGICKSASGKSLHVWTKITPISVKHDNKKVEYLCNFRHKYSYIYIVLTKYANQLGYTTEKIEEFMDMAMAKPQQGIFITSDDHPIMNTNFLDRRLDVNFEPAFNTGIESIDWIAHPALKSIFSKLEWFNNENFDNKANVELTDVSNTNDRDASKNIRKHYRHAQRWQLANTLTNIYGFDKALQYMVEICKDTPYKELRGDVKTADIHHKPISIWAINQLNKFHGFKIKLNNAQEIFDETQMLSNKPETEDKKFETVENNNRVVFNIRHNQYLSDIKEDIISNLSQITLLEAGAGYGKTEMIKAFKAKTCLILPFTSTIKAKVEKSEVTEDWLYYYGSKRPTLDELLGNRNMSMTIDKFSRLNVMELDQAGFEYIVIDESHLLFTSSYRDVMAPTIQRLANCKAKVIMMTGTPTGELIFFPEIKHIKVIKEDTRIKHFDLHYCMSKYEKNIEMCKMMAQDIMEGRKILFPTNKGTLFYEQIIGIIQRILSENCFGRQLNSFYYKKANYGDESMDNINYDKTIGNNDIIVCSTYLSVGVDICDRYTFSVYFDEPWIPQDIEQFANRLRNNDLFIKMFLPKVDESGFPINYNYNSQLNLEFDEADLILVRDLVRTCNDMIERNNEEAKSNPLIQSIIAANKYLKYDENTCKYYIDETMYKLRIFEERYSQYGKQTSVIKDGVEYYGYVFSEINHDEVVPDDKKTELDEFFRSCRNIRYNHITEQTRTLLNSITDNNIDIYREILKGNLDIMRGHDTANESIREANSIYTESIEIVEKNVPIVLSLYKFYNIDTIKDIYEYCISQKQNRINYSKLNRIRRFISIVNSIKHKRLDLPIFKFVTESKKWVTEHPITTKPEIDTFLTDYAVKIANNVKDVIVEDARYLETIYEKLCDLWKVIVIQTKAKEGYNLQPFELLWKVKDSMDNIYGGISTKTFFLQELLDEMKDIDDIEEEIEYFPTINENEELPALEHTSKVKLDDIKTEIKSIVDKSYDYFDYSQKDGSNERFMEKQKNTNAFRDNIFDMIDEEEAKKKVRKFEQETLF